MPKGEIIDVSVGNKGAIALIKQNGTNYVFCMG